MVGPELPKTAVWRASAAHLDEHSSPVTVSTAEMRSEHFRKRDLRRAL